MKAYLISYNYEQFDCICGFKQLQQFTQYRIENYEYDEDNSTFDYQDFNNLTEQECLDILEQDGYTVKQYEIY